VVTTESTHRPDTPLPGTVPPALHNDKEKEEDSGALIIAESDSDGENSPVNGRANLPESPSPPVIAEEEAVSPEIQPKPLLNGDIKDHETYPPLLNGSNERSSPNGIAISSPDNQEIKQHNLNIRTAAYREIKKPGRNFNGIFEELSRLKGSLDLRKSVVVDVINECLRFKRRVLADLVKQFMNSLGRDPEVL